MKRSSCVSIVALVAAAVACGPQAQAQFTSPPSFSLQFAGGTIGEYVNALQEASGGANIVVASPEVGAIRFPPVRLESVTLEAAVIVLEGEYPTKQAGNVYVSAEMVGHPAEGVKPLFRISANRQTHLAAEVKVWSVADLIAGSLAPEDFLTAVEAVVELIPGHQPAEIRFHKETGLLIARGDPHQLDAIEGVVEQIRGNVVLEEVFAGLEPWGAAQAGPAKALERLQGEVARLEGSVAEKNQEIESLRMIVRDLELQLNERPKP